MKAAGKELVGTKGSDEIVADKMNLMLKIKRILSVDVED